MIVEIFTAVSQALSRPSAFSFGAAFLWGILSVILSPCHLGSIPLIIGFVNKGERPSRKRAFFLSLLFSTGLLVTLSVLGLIAWTAGSLFGRVGPVPKIAAGIFLILCGLWLMDIPPLSRAHFFPALTPKRGKWGALTLGLIYGVVLGPCSFAFLAPMIGIVFSAGSGPPVFGIALMILYAAGHCLTIAAAGTTGDALLGYLSRKRGEAVAVWARRLCGLFVVVLGLYSFF